MTNTPLRSQDLKGIDHSEHVSADWRMIATRKGLKEIYLETASADARGSILGQGDWSCAHGSGL